MTEHPISETWLNDAVATARDEWTAEYTAHGLPEPTEREQAIFRLGFASGVDAGVQRCADILTQREE